ncbi:hypothetical protein BJ994_000151 [Arthrobacter pigmenti]|uniref:HNH nuclease domain-containing protein n=1 Tax=Arthrobacter pigmenti TaxID=271432 RepID=A0A846RMM7_9MICC|nr:HNH endonuclease signature motif containing protein [Arthrobacter pigmenti]NJC21075.1 hypothetical protein [Arthrobacter pigmenti]
MTLEVSFEGSLGIPGGYLWDDFLTEHDFRVEDLEEYHLGAELQDDPAPELLDLVYPAFFEERPDGAGGRAASDASSSREPSVSQLVWELSGPPSTVAGPVSEHDAERQSATNMEPGTEPTANDDAGDAASVGPSGCVADPASRGDLSGRVALQGLDELDLGALAGVLTDLAGLRSWVDAVEARVVSRIADRTREWVEPRQNPGSRRSDMVRSATASEIALAHNVPERSAYGLVEESIQLTERHPATLDALTEGRISRRHAVLIAQQSLGVPDEAVRGFEEELLALAESLTVAKLARRARRLREEHHPETLPVRKARAVTERHIEYRPDDDGMAWFHAYLPAEQACGIYNRLTAAACRLNTPDESRTLTQLRADVFADLLTHMCPPENEGSESNASGSEPAGRGEGRRHSRQEARGDRAGWMGIAASVNITVPVLALLDVLNANTAGQNSDAKTDARTGAGTNTTTNYAANADTDAQTGADTHARTEDPANAGAGSCGPGMHQFAELEGYGPIDMETAARLAGHATSFTRILTHPVSGSVLDVGRETYRPPKHLQDWIRARDRTCRHPGCSRAAMTCEIDHTVPWSHGGTTCHCNLACLCKKHHMYKSEGICQYAQSTPGVITVRTKAGTTRTTSPDPPF